MSLRITINAINAIDETTIGMKSTSLWDIMMSGVLDAIDTEDIKVEEDRMDVSVSDTDITSVSPPSISPLGKGMLKTRSNFSSNSL